MAWSLVAAVAAGILIGLRYRVFALIAATLLTILVGATGMWLAGFSGYRLFVSTIYLVLALQGAYLLGLGVATLWRSK